MRRILLIFILFAANACALLAQDGVSKKAQKFFSEGLQQYHFREYNKAAELFQKSMEAEPGWLEPYHMLATVYEAQEKYDDAIGVYQKWMADKQPDVSIYFNLAGLYFRTGKYDEAIEQYRKAIDTKLLDSRRQQVAQDRIKRAGTAKELMANPVPFEPINMGEAINSHVNEYFPAFTIDGETMYFTRRKVVDSIPARQIYHYNEDLMYSRRENNQWQTARTVPGQVNSNDNEGAVTIAPDGSFMVFAGCERKDGYGSCDLYISFYMNGAWTKPVNMQPPINTRWKETQPSISFDGRSIYFSSSRPGGQGGMDLWVSTRDDNWNFSEPVNLGPVVNTSSNEQSPFIHPDDQTLYFVSNGHPGMGLNDIFYSRRPRDSAWQQPVNFGYPVNTSGDEAGLVVDRAGEYAYISSNTGGAGKLDIFYFKLPQQAKPKPVTYLKAKVFDADTKKPLKAWLELVDLQTGKTVISRNTDEEGQILAALPQDRDYLVNVSANGYVFYSDNLPLKEYKKTEPYIKEIGLTPIRPGAVIRLNNVFFATDKYELKPESKSELDRVIAFMEKNKDIKIEISGHTDNTGSPAHNKELSQNRAKSVYNYLVNEGKIDPSRLTYKGYGERKPVATNNTEEGKALNRRTEIKITQ